ncbi:MAG: MoaD/ThiS family protein [Pseudomonadales bacterium]
MIEVVFFASLREDLGSSGFKIDPSGINNINDVIDSLASAQGTHFKDILIGDNILVAINQEMGDVDTTVNDEDEVAFFPPVTGG